MIYRLVSVWRDTEEPDAPIMRSARDFASIWEAEAWIAGAASSGVARFDVYADRMENGAKLLATIVPICRVSGWFIWELPDDTPMWAIGAAA